MTNKKSEGLDSVTSSECKWSKPRKRHLTPKKSQQLSFKKHKFESEVEKNDKRCKQKLFEDKVSETKPLKVTQINLDRFSNKLKKCNPHAAWLTTISDDDDETESTFASEEVLSILHNLPFMFHDNKDLNMESSRSFFQDQFKTLSCSKEKCSEIEKMTRGQNKNESWMEARMGRITSSVFGQVLKKKDSTSPESTLRTVLGYSSFDNISTKWGRQHEPAARRIYLKSQLKDHPGLTVTQCGLLVNPDFPYLGSSPDGLVSCPCEKCKGNPEGVLEVKCPYKSRFMSVSEASTDPKFFCYLDNGVVKLKQNHNYYFQVQGQMAISNRKWCDFFVWTLRGYTVERISFNEKFWSDCLQKLCKFYIAYVLSELFTERVKRGKPLNVK